MMYGQLDHHSWKSPYGRITLFYTEYSVLVFLTEGFSNRMQNAAEVGGNRGMTSFQAYSSPHFLAATKQAAKTMKSKDSFRYTYLCNWMDLCGNCEGKSSRDRPAPLAHYLEKDG
ncbi:hypothetical protein TESG_05748 [Trichophyton tonsurans CBS 112818]|uniref:Uncharacterized protein n=2 Tax=Trichophyton TaxID=5550 RepID=F2PX81_TRIEC|nr:hypothetical protein TESG_05748 [Trichophyton tonsurans CBS 112818]EGE06499.1 hypothetical protein TEQG_05499 [Trichophyton equinum CBS 127.97]